MVDHGARAKAFQSLRRFVACETTNDEYEDEYPLPELFGRRRSSDRAVRAIYEFSWSWFDDIYPHKLEGKHSLTEEAGLIAERCLLFLQSDLEYEWKEGRFIGNGSVSSVLVTLGLTQYCLSLTEQLAAHLDQPEGDASVWPFFRKTDYDKVVK